ncbi:hypothetical protein ABI59_05360 [Acidobacteria bacterium Mor1]|nr:hypothetical protein ABI59_05360 [Acidobacteria bacterium Mor1]
MPIVLAVHGGAWNIPDAAVEAHREGVREALRAGWAALSEGGSALDAVEIAVRVLEEDPTFDAGVGSRLNRERKVELDASIMCGRELNAGAVAAVQRVRHPISLARKVMEETHHVMLCGQGASQFADEIGMKRCRTRDLLVGRELERYERVMAGDRRPVQEEFEKPAPMGTVGAIAMDGRGNLAAATSTGGIQDKMPGRVGDTPIPGSGTFADNKLGAASCTGHGEKIMRVVLAKAAVDRLAGDVHPSTAGMGALSTMRRVRGKGGLILLDRYGRVSARFNTPRMARGVADEAKGLRVGVDRGALRR